MESGADIMSIPVPVAVRLFNVFSKAYDIWVTRWLSDITYRTVIPGGFASATIELANEYPGQFDAYTHPYTRVQVVDIRTGQVCWEGRIEDPRRSEDGSSWELGCLGTMVVGTDVRIPYFAIDGDVSNWAPASAAHGDTYNPSVDANTQSLKFKPYIRTWIGPNHDGDIFVWSKAYICDARIGRFDATYSGYATTAGFRTGMDVLDSASVRQNNIDLTAWNAATVRKGNKVVTDFTSIDAQRLEVAFDYTSASTTNADDWYGSVDRPLVQIQRMDRFGNKLQTAASYPNEWVTVAQIVEDVVGRFFVGSYFFNDGRPPFGTVPAVNSDRTYIDTTGTAKITNLTYYEGATAADVLNDLMIAQPGAFWAIWESEYRSYEFNWSVHGHTFEWSTWPKSFGYQADTKDGVEEQPSGEDPYNAQMYIYHYVDYEDVEYAYLNWRGGIENTNQHLEDANLNRVETFYRDEGTTSANWNADVFGVSNAMMDEFTKTPNTGKLKIARPIHLYDRGDTGRGGASMMVDPWAIRAGKLILIRDLPIDSRADRIMWGNTPFAKGHNTAIFRIVGTNYSASTGICELELDQVSAWDNATQVIKDAPGKGKLVVRG
jgi:hypothetical protein